MAGDVSEHVSTSAATVASQRADLETLDADEKMEEEAADILLGPRVRRSPARDRSPSPPSPPTKKRMRSSKPFKTGGKNEQKTKALRWFLNNAKYVEKGPGFQVGTRVFRRALLAALDDKINKQFTKADCVAENVLPRALLACCLPTPELELTFTDSTPITVIGLRLKN